MENTAYQLVKVREDLTTDELTETSRINKEEEYQNLCVSLAKQSSNFHTQD